jgi:hypothetical protein
LHPKDTPYAFALHGLEGEHHLYPYVLTEEGLNRVAKRYVAEGYYETVAEARKNLRYSVEDSPYAGELEGQLPTVDSLMEPVEATLEEMEGYALLAKAAMDAFITLDKRGLFGDGKQREKVLLLIETSLAETDWSKVSAKRLNSSAAFRRYEAETKIEAPYVSCDVLAVSPDGQLLFFAGSRATSPDKDPSISEVVACEIAGLRLKRRWEVSARLRNGESTRQLACGPDGTLFLLQAKYSETECTTILARISRGNKATLKQTKMPGEPADFAVSHDGTVVAVATFDGRLHLINDKLEIVGSRELRSVMRGPRFLKTGELLGMTTQGLITMASNLTIKDTWLCHKAAMISLDAEEELCAVWRWPKDGLISDRKARDQFGFQIFSFPNMKPLRTIQSPAHQLSDATLSPDGRLVACKANECGKYQSFVVVYETQTGREIARKKSDSYGFVFLPGRDVLAMTRAGHLTSEPVILWRFQ